MKSSGKFYALKIINKEKSDVPAQKKYTVTEKKILKMISHQFIVNLFIHFETKSYLFLLLEHLPGRDLAAYLDEEGSFSEAKARFYLCECIAAINALHKKGIIYRDLKPNNIMLDDKGHVKLIDFNLSKAGFNKFNLRTKSFWGSYAYMPPEILQHKSYGKNIDWYLCGVLLYEMLTGLPPYFHKNAKLIQKNIIQNKLKIPKDLSPNCRDLLKWLLNKDVSKRLGAKNGIDEILNHPWFEGMKLIDIESRATESSSKESRLEGDPPTLVHQNESLQPFVPYLSQSPEEATEDISSSMKHKMEEFNERYLKQIQKLIE